MESDREAAARRGHSRAIVCGHRLESDVGGGAAQEKRQTWIQQRCPVVVYFVRALLQPCCQSCANIGDIVLCWGTRAQGKSLLLFHQERAAAALSQGRGAFFYKGTGTRCSLKGNLQLPPLKEERKFDNRLAIACGPKPKP